MKTPLRPFTVRGKEVWVKDESHQPVSHTHKDRRSRLLVRQALERGTDAVAILTAGNGGYSLAKIAQGTRLRIAAVIDPSLSPGIKEALLGAGAELYETDLSQKRFESEDIIHLVRKHSGESIIDATNGTDEAYKPIVDEILEDKPDTSLIVCPVGSGELFMGMQKRITELRLPIELAGVGVSSPDSPAKKLFALWTPNTHLIEKITRQRGHLFRLTNSEVIEALETAPHDLKTEPSSSVVFGVVERLPQQHGIVLINTGQGLL